MSPYAYEVGGQLTAYRGRIRRDRRARYLSGAALTIAAYWLLAALLYYFGAAPDGTFWFGLLLTLGLPPGAVLLEWLRRPSFAGAAALIDRRLDDKERLTTAVQLLDQREHNAVADAQLESTANLLLRVDPARVYPESKPWPALALSGGLLLLAFGIVLLKGALGDFVPLQSSSLPPDQNSALALASPTPQSNLPGSNPAGANSAPGNSGDQAGSGAGNPQDAADQAAASSAAEQALKELGSELDGQSAAQGAADSLKQGDYGQAGQQLAQLGKDSDQLSERAKSDLANALDRASNNSDQAPGLQQAERAAADALRKGDYKGIAEAMQNLGQAVEQTGQQVVPQEDLAKNYPTPGPGDADTNGQPQNGADQAGDNNGAGDGSQPGDGNQPSDQANGGNQPGGSGDGNSPGSGSASDSGTRVTGPTAQNDMPNVAGNPFELENKPDSGNSSPGDVDTPSGLTLQGDSGNSTGGSRGSGSAGTATGESNNQPIERWPVIEKYFEHGQ